MMAEARNEGQESLIVDVLEFALAWGVCLGK
jgi:hypothetical protein